MKKLLNRMKGESFTGHVMSLPYVLYFSVFIAFPIGFSFLLMFHKWNIITPMEYYHTYGMGWVEEFRSVGQ